MEFICRSKCVIVYDEKLEDYVFDALSLRKVSDWPIVRRTRGWEDGAVTFAAEEVAQAAGQETPHAL